MQHDQVIGLAVRKVHSKCENTFLNHCAAPRSVCPTGLKSMATHSAPRSEAAGPTHIKNYYMRRRTCVVVCVVGCFCGVA